MMMKSSWGTQIVKGISAAEKKTKTRVLQAASRTKKVPLGESDSANRKHKKNDNNGNHQTGIPNSKNKRSLIGDLSCSIAATQVHPQGAAVHEKEKTKPLSSSEDLFLEIDHLRNSLHEYQERELILQAQLSECKKNPKVVELSQQLASEEGKKEPEKKEHDSSNGIAMEVLELRRLNKELQLQKRSLSSRVSSLECQLISLDKDSQNDIVEKIKAEASELRHTNEGLYKQVEGLQISRMNEVEELAYLRWVNSCLRDELLSFSSTNPGKTPSPKSGLKSTESSKCILPDATKYDDTAAQRVYLTKKLKKWPITDDDFQQMKYATDDSVTYSWDELRSSPRRYSISGAHCGNEDVVLNKKRQSDSFICSKERDQSRVSLVNQRFSLELSNRPHVYDCGQVISKLSPSFHVEKKASRVPNPPPRPSFTGLSRQKDVNSDEMAHTTIPVPPIPPPPPMKSIARSITNKVQRAPQVVEFYHSLMRRESRKDCLSSTTTDSCDVANARSSMIGEIENRSSHLLAIKADVETQGEFVKFLIREVNDVVYQNIDDVVAFVNWLDDELCYLVDERAVLKHFEWPEKKADTLREAAFSYKDLKKLEQDVSHYKDDPSLSCDIALKKIAALSERMERTVHNILRTRDSLMRNFKEFQIPTDWMLDVGILTKIKFGSVKLAKVYMKRVAMELQYKGGTVDKDTSLDYMLLQGVRFAFRIHQFAGGFDPETMQAFEELRDLASFLNKSKE